MNQLTDKQRAFVFNKAAGVPNREAALAAGYSAAAADVTATKLLRKPAIQAAIKSETIPGDAKPGAPQMPRKQYTDSMAFLVDVMNHAQLPIALRGDAAKQLLPYQHARMGEVGKKEKAKDRAHALVGGKFTPKQAPRLHVVKD